jgi:hypothetical protein
MTPSARQASFNIPFNTMFMPAEYASINCCPECYFDGSEWYCPPCSGGGNSNPTLGSITPSSAAANAGSVAVTLAGGFNDASEKVIISGSGVSANPNPAPIDADGNADTNFEIVNSVVAGNYNVSVFDSGGPSNSVTFTVTPVITSISPAKGLVGSETSVTINGAGFASGATVNAGSDIAVTDISVNSSTQMTATFTPTNLPSAGGNQSVTVTVNGQSSNSQNFFDQVPTALVVTAMPYFDHKGLAFLTFHRSVPIADERQPSS